MAGYKIPKAKLGSGERFAHLKKALAKKGVRDPSALSAAIGMRKYGKNRFLKLARAGKK